MAMPPPRPRHISGSSMVGTNLVVVRYADGRVLKGTTRDFSALRPFFHVEHAHENATTEIRVREIKALFFVKSLDGWPDRVDVPGFLEGPGEKPQGRKVAVLFRDGEFMCGYTMSWSADRDGFFLSPADTHCNNTRVFVAIDATSEVHTGPQADELAQRVLAARSGRDAARGPRPERHGPPYGPR